ncbi:hypothetical protein [Winogradskyella sp. Asnod2-B02-A]|uniref:hypothetical protein n=1 Tax=Winogradskyella sp. Asnod2-B02-A TaxID=3160583 RepID=UPI003869E192
MKNKLFTERKTYYKYIAFYVLLLMASFSYAQVGVGNTNPQATLDITASNQAAPSNVDGILIPRIDTFPATNPTAAQDAMLVYLTTTVGLNSKGFYYWDQATTSWIRFSSIEKLNDLSDAKSDVDGLNDGSSIFIGINAGLNDDADNNQNVGVGFNALMTNVDGDANSAFGFQALSLNTDINNSAFGFRALAKNSSGRRNSAFGRGALEENTTANFNTAVGTQALATNTTGASNVAIGEKALIGNLTGDGNTAVGAEALTNNIATVAEGSSTAVGYHALHTNTSGARNTAVGYEALNTAGTANNNSAFGHNALSTNTSGNNTAMGSFAGDLSSGASNVIIGQRAGSELAGAENVLIGQHAGRILIGNNNVFIGRNSGRTTTGNSNVFIGDFAGYDTAFASVSNTLVIQNEDSAIPLIYGDFTNDRVGIAKIATTHALEVEGTTEATQYKLSALNTAPASATDTGVEGEIRVTATHIYVCTATDTWVRTALATW